MRKNHAIKEYDRVYVSFNRLRHIRTLTAHPLKTTYINLCAAWDATDRSFREVAALENFCEKYRIELP